MDVLKFVTTQLDRTLAVVTLDIVLAPITTPVMVLFKQYYSNHELQLCVMFTFRPLTSRPG